MLCSEIEIQNSEEFFNKLNVVRDPVVRVRNLNNKIINVAITEQTTIEPGDEKLPIKSSSVVNFAKPEENAMTQINSSGLGLCALSCINKLVTPNCMWSKTRVLA